MREKQSQVLSAFNYKVPNSKYNTQKRKLEAELKFFTSQFNYNKLSVFLFEHQEI